MTGDRAWDLTRVEDIMDGMQTREGPLLPILHELQKEFGHVPEPAIALVAARLNLSRAEVHGVVSFYHDFRTTPGGRHILKVCRAEACQSMGAEQNVSDLLARLDLRSGETTADGRLTIEPVYCLGLCATAPAAMLDGEPHGRLDTERLTALAATAV